MSEISALGFLLLRNIYSFLFFSKHRSFSLSLDIGGSCLRPFQDVKEPFQGFVSHIRCISSENKNAEGYTSDSALQSRPSLAFIINAASPHSAAKMGMSGWVGAGKAEASSESTNAPQVGEFREEDQNLLRFPSE